MDNFEDIDNDTLNELVLGTLDGETLPTQSFEGEHDNTHEQMPEIGHHANCTQGCKNEEGNNNEAEPQMKEKLLCGYPNEI